MYTSALRYEKDTGDFVHMHRIISVPKRQFPVRRDSTNFAYKRRIYLLVS